MLYPRVKAENIEEIVPGTHQCEWKPNKYILCNTAIKSRNAQLFEDGLDSRFACYYYY